MASTYTAGNVCRTLTTPQVKERDLDSSNTYVTVFEKGSLSRKNETDIHYKRLKCQLCKRKAFVYILICAEMDLPILPALLCQISSFKTTYIEVPKRAA